MSCFAYKAVFLGSVNTSNSLKKPHCFAGADLHHPELRVRGADAALLAHAGQGVLTQQPEKEFDDVNTCLSMPASCLGTT